MRQLMIQVPKGQGATVLQMAKACNGVNLVQTEVHDPDNHSDLVIVHVPNRQVEGLLTKLHDLSQVQITLFPTGVITLRPPESEVSQQVTNVQARSPVEIFLSGLQSVGSWKSFIGYAVAAGIIVWIGLFTNTSYLLVAAMLIAPFAGPAMNSAIAVARGDLQLLKQSLVRYFSALGVTIAIAFLLTMIFQQSIATSLMTDTSQVSIVAVLLPLTAGAAGALNLAQSERSSLVSGAAAGMLLAASLSPPAGIVGMAIAMGRWDMAHDGVFLLLLQLAGIQLSAALIFRVYGLSPQRSQYARGKKRVFPIGAGIALASLGLLLTWQLSDSPSLQRSSRAQRARTEVLSAIEETQLAQLIEANVRFTRPNREEQNMLLVEVYAQRQEGVTASTSDIHSALTQAIQRRLLNQGFNVTPLVSVTVLEALSQNQ
ncbi:DUF389 domain-containing protein [Myxacorys almedinensis]|uniref:DUF389 domain-containing protein n=1 Tax=Myxacorys almedinensis A TaxID=2690445 RepID=A0A8J8CJU9_9CYAN|nr:DUF389 domain-containing protein [Myxacorys almedinensis]NDJ15920.1 DUF389 domain-containing protein [Myxacorys almedinensis A]